MSNPLHITIYFDGTRNSKDNDGPQGTHTNVARLYALDRAYGYNLSRNSGHQPLQYDGSYRSGLPEKVYFDGVGSHRNNMAAMAFECATGSGGQSRIEQAYAALVAFHNKYPDTTVGVNVVGFSRGAAQARALANVLIERGVPRLDSERQVTGEYLIAPGEAKINKLAIFDTVASYGNPLTDGHTDKNLEIHRNISSTTHLVAMNEYRKTFPLTSALRNDDNTRIEEIRFAGAHSQVGGGYRDDVLAAGPLALMYDRLQAAGVELEPLLPEDAVRLQQYNTLIADSERLQDALIDSRLSAGNEAFIKEPDGSYRVLDNRPFAMERGIAWGRQKHPFEHEVHGRKVIYENDDSLARSPWQIGKAELVQRLSDSINLPRDDKPAFAPVVTSLAQAKSRRHVGFEPEKAALETESQAQVEQLSALSVSSRPLASYLDQLALAPVPVPVSVSAARYAVVRINPAGSAAFSDLGFAYEAGRILDDAAQSARDKAPLALGDQVILRDTNGNPVGSLEAMREAPEPESGQQVLVALDMHRVPVVGQAEFLQDGFRQASAWVAQREAAPDGAAFLIPGGDGKPVGQVYLEHGSEPDVLLRVDRDGPHP